MSEPKFRTGDIVHVGLGDDKYIAMRINERSYVNDGGRWKYGFNNDPRVTEFSGDELWTIEERLLPFCDPNDLLKDLL